MFGAGLMLYMKGTFMSFLRPIYQPFACLVGVHHAPPPREPAGPIAASCPCCGKVIYFYGLTAIGVVQPYPVIPQISFPKVLGPVPKSLPAVSA